MNPNPPLSPIEKEVAQIIAASRVKSAQDFLREFSMSAFDKAVALNALIMSAGYVGLFSLWDRVKDDLSYCERLLIVAFITISLTIYLGWTLKAQWTIAHQQLNFSKTIAAIDINDPKTVREMLDKFRTEGATARVFAQRYLPLVMGSAIAFAAMAAIIMVIACFARISASQL